MGAWEETIKASLKKTRKADRQGILANFKFCVDEAPEEMCEGITINVSDHGFGFLTEAEIRQGQTITVTKHALCGFPFPKAKVMWVIRGPRYAEAGAEFQSGS